MQRTVFSVLALTMGLGLVSACQKGEETAPQEPRAMAHGAPLVDGAPRAPSVFDAPQPVGTAATCPVLGNSFVITLDTLHSEYRGKHVYFCCAGCKPQFDASPQKYLK